MPGPRAVLPGLGAYEGEALIEAAILLPEWYLPAATGQPTSEEETQAYRAAWRASLAHLPTMPDTLLLRDYHKDNLLWLPARPGVRACGLLDFQDAQQGHPSYDLVSLIEDARRDVPADVHEACFNRYVAEAGLDRQDFAAGFAVMGRPAPCAHHRPVRAAAEARRQARLSCTFAARLADVRTRPAARYSAAIARLGRPPVATRPAAHRSEMIKRGEIDTAIILAAGRGERMRPLTDSMPKPLIPVAGRSMLDRSIEHLQACGVRNFVINVHHLGEQIVERFEKRAHIIREDRLLETGGSVKNALPLLGDKPFFVLNGDSLWRDGPDGRCWSECWDDGSRNAWMPSC